MNKKGFTLVELLATIVVMAIVVGIAIVSTNVNLNNAKDKTEEIFISTLEDTMKIYIDTDAKGLNYSSDPVCTLNKTHGKVNVYKAISAVNFDTIINSNYHPITKKDLVNPNNQDVTCNSSANISIYRDSDYVYYYKVKKSDIGCLKTTGNITNLPSECAA